MLEPSHLSLLALIALGALYWWHGQGMRQRVLAACTRHCRDHAVQLLDQSVSLRRLWLRRDERGRLKFWRLYEFEFASPENDRYKGRAVTLGDRVLDITWSLIECRVPEAQVINMMRGFARFCWRLLALMIVLSIAAVAALRWVNPPWTAFMLWDRIDNDRELRQQWVPLDSISPHLRITVVAAEDQKFPTHYGFDFQSIAEAIEENRERPRGASTITQQVAKNLFLWNGHSYVRKLIEAWFAALIELFWPKQRILESIERRDS